MTTARAATLYGPKDLRLVDRPLDELAPGFVRVRFAAGGICGSDMHYYSHGRIGNFVATAPLVLGHEVAGVVEAVGEGVTTVAPGARVAVNPSRWCGHCDRCREGRRNLCENIYFMGSASKTPHMQGGFATWFDALPEQCVPVPDAVPFEAAALAEPLAVCLHAVNRGNVAGKSRRHHRRRPDRPPDHARGKAQGRPRDDDGRHRRRRRSPSPRASAPTGSSISPPTPSGLAAIPRAGRGDRGVGQPQGAGRRDHGRRGAAAPSSSSAACRAETSPRRSTR